MRIPVINCLGGIVTAIICRLKEKGHSLVGLDLRKPTNASLFPLFYKVDLNQIEEILSVCNKLKKEVPSLWSIVFCVGIFP